MTENNTIVSRRERRARNTLARAVASNAGTAGRTAAVALAASGLVITSGVAANAAAEGPSEEGREVTTLQVNASDLTVERTSNSAPVAVTASHEVELAFDRPVVSTSPAPDTTQAAEGSSSAEITPATSQASIQQGSQTPAAQTPATLAPASQTGAAPQGNGQAVQQSQAPAPQAQQAPAQQSQSSTTAASSTQAAPAPAPAPSGGNGSVASAAYGGVGSPYSYGGTTTAGFDCSGFVNWAYARAGRGGVPRTTHGMMASLPRVSTPQPGDIVIANGQGHAGIYVGNGQVISATVSGGVRLHGAHEGWHRVTAYLRPGG